MPRRRLAFILALKLKGGVPEHEAQAIAAHLLERGDDLGGVSASATTTNSRFG